MVRWGCRLETEIVEKALRPGAEGVFDVGAAVGAVQVAEGQAQQYLQFQLRVGSAEHKMA